MNYIEYLADFPAYIEEVAQLKYAQWQHTAPERPYEVWVEEIEHSSRRNGLPMTLVALQEKELLGFVTLVEIREKAGIKNGVWLITLFVKGQHRDAGHGRNLIERCLAEVHSKGYSAIHLWTESTHLTDYYARYGWHLLGQDESGEDIMVYDLDKFG